MKCVFEPSPWMGSVPNRVGLPSVRTTTSWYVGLACATCQSAWSQFVPAEVCQSAYCALNASAPACVDTDRSSGWLASAPSDGDVALNEKTAMRDGVPTRASAKESAAALRSGRSEPTDADRSSTRATSAPHCTGSAGLSRDVCQTPPERVGSAFDDERMKSRVERYVWPATSAGTWNV